MDEVYAVTSPRAKLPLRKFKGLKLPLHTLGKKVCRNKCLPSTTVISYNSRKPVAKIRPSRIPTLLQLLTQAVARLLC